MRELTDLQKQMCNDLVVIEGAYVESIWKDMPFSVSIPNEMTDLEMIHCMDGDQPCYRNAAVFTNLCCETVGYFHTIADYPVTGDTLRFAFFTREDADKFLDAVMRLPCELYD